MNNKPHSWFKKNAQLPCSDLTQVRSEFDEVSQQMYDTLTAAAVEPNFGSLFI